MWDTQLLYKDRNVRAMQRAPYILSPNHTSMQRWDGVILAAMLYVSTVTPYEVCVRARRVVSPAGRASRVQSNDRGARPARADARARARRCR